MGLFDRLKKKKQDSDKTPEIEATKARVEAINGGKFNADEAYEKSIAYFAEEEAKQARRIKEAENINNEVMGRISHLNNAPGARRANKVAHEMAVELEKELKKRETAEELLEEKLEKLKRAGYPQRVIDIQREKYKSFITRSKKNNISEESLKSTINKIFNWVDNPDSLEQNKPMWENMNLLETYLEKLIDQGFPIEAVNTIRKEQTMSMDELIKKGMKYEDIRTILENNVGQYVNDKQLIEQEIKDISEGIDTPEKLLEIYLKRLQEQGAPKQIINDLHESEKSSLTLARESSTVEIIKNSILKRDIRKKFEKYCDPQIYTESPENYLNACLARLQEKGIAAERIKEYRNKISQHLETLKSQSERPNYVLNRAIVDDLNGLIAADTLTDGYAEQPVVSGPHR